MLLECSELWGQLDGVYLLVHDPELLDYGSVEHLPDRLVSAQVEQVGVVAEGQQVFEELVGPVCLQVVVLDQLLGLGDLPGDALLLLLEQLLGDGFGVEGLEQLLAFLLQGSNAPLLGWHLLAGAAQLGVDLGCQGGAQGVDVGLGEAHGVPEVFDFTLNLEGAGRALDAVLSLLAVEAVEVVVGGAVPVGGAEDAEATGAAGTGQVTLEVVDVLLRLLAGLVASAQDGLHLVEGCLVNEGGVGAVVLDVFKADFAQVVAVGQHTVHGGVVYRV